MEAYDAGDGVQEVGRRAGGPGRRTRPPQNIIGRIATDTGAVQQTPNPGGDATGIVFGNDQAYWSAEFATDSVARVAPDGSITHPIQFAPIAAGDGVDPRHITTGANDTLWVGLEDLTSNTNMRIARITGVDPAARARTRSRSRSPSRRAAGLLRRPAAAAPPRHARARALRASSVTPSRVRRGRRTRDPLHAQPRRPPVTLRFDRVRRGRRRGGRCVAPTRRLRRAHALHAASPASAPLDAPGASAGTTTISFDGRLSGRRLPRRLLRRDARRPRRRGQREPAAHPALPDPAAAPR